MESRYQPVENYGVIGNLRTAALVGMDGSIDWLCLPRFDSPSLFGRLLDWEKGGTFSLRPEGAGETSQKYVDRSAVLVTKFPVGSGRVRVADFMPPRPSRNRSANILVRRIESDVDARFVLRFDPRQQVRQHPRLHRRARVPSARQFCRAAALHVSSLKRWPQKSTN